MSKRPTNNQHSGFTLIELLIVIAVIGVLAAVILIIIKPYEQLAKTRDAGRKSTLRQLADALDRYYVKKGLYPITGVNTWCGEPGSSWTSCGADWIPGLLASNEITALPRNPKGSTICLPPDRSYVYRSDDGSCFKLLAHCAPEATGAFDPNDPFYDSVRPTWAWMVCSPKGSACCGY